MATSLKSQEAWVIRQWSRFKKNKLQSYQNLFGWEDNHYAQGVIIIIIMNKQRGFDKIFGSIGLNTSENHHTLGFEPATASSLSEANHLREMWGGNTATPQAQTRKSTPLLTFSKVYLNSFFFCLANFLLLLSPSLLSLSHSASLSHPPLPRLHLLSHSFSVGANQKLP